MLQRGVFIQHHFESVWCFNYEEKHYLLFKDNFILILTTTIFKVIHWKDLILNHFFAHFICRLDNYAYNYGILAITKCWYIAVNKRFHVPQRKKSRCVKSHDLGDHLIGTNHEINSSSNIFLIRYIAADAVCHSAPSCRNWIGPFLTFWAAKSLKSSTDSEHH